MPTSYIRRGAALRTGQTGTAGASPIYVNTSTSTVNVVPAATGTVEKVLVDTDTAQILASKTLTSPTINAPTIAGGSQAGVIDSDIKILAADFTANIGGTGATLTGLTGFSWAVVPGTYRFRAFGKTAQTTNGGMSMAFKLTTAVISSGLLCTLQTVAATPAYASSTTVTDQAKFIDGKVAAYIYTEVNATLVVGTGGTIALQAAQNTAHADTTTLYAGFSACLERVS